jgi:hypothetical protein
MPISTSEKKAWLHTNSGKISVNVYTAYGTGCNINECIEMGSAHVLAMPEKRGPGYGLWWVYAWCDDVREKETRTDASAKMMPRSYVATVKPST